MQRIELEVNVRELQRRGAVRRMRAQGNVPAILYGGGIEPIRLSINDRSLERVLRTGANALIDLKGPKEVKGKVVLVKEIQRDPVSQRLLHCDVYAVDAKKKLQVAVPIHFEGKPVGVEQQGGILDTPAREIEVSCLPFSIPERINVDVSNLSIGDAIHLRDITLPDDVEVISDESLTLAHVSAPRVEEEPVAEEVPTEEEAAAAEAAPAEGEPGDAKPEE